MDINDLTLGQIQQLTSMFDAPKNNAIQNLGKNIVILQRGWVLIGDFYKQGHDCILKNCSVIRNWGTTKGLGEIAKNGRTDKTILDETPDCSFNELTAIFFIKCDESKW